MRNIKKIFCLCLLVFFSAGLFGEDSEFNYSKEWHVCVGSYKVKKNALNRIEQLKKYDIETFCSEASVKDEVYYRLITKEKFDSIQDARKYRDELSSLKTADELGLKGLWVCQRMIKKSSVKLEKNSVDENTFTEEKPYSVVINTYKEESVAQTDKERLKEKEIDSYIVKKYDDEELFSFDLNSGAYKTKEEAEQHKEIIEEAGVVTKEVVDFTQEKEAIKKYDEVVQNEDIVFDNGIYVAPEILSESVQNVLNNFPVNKFYQIEEAYIFDVKNCRKNELSYGSGSFVSELLKREDVIACSSVLYNDELFNKQIIVFMVEADETFDLFKEESVAVASQNFKIRDGILHCDIYETDIAGSDNKEYILHGNCPEKNLYLYMYSENFTQEEFLAFLDSNSEGEDLLIYPQMRRTLLVLPDENSEIEREFCYFELKKIGMDYAREKNYSNWSIPIVGHWNANAYIAQNSEQIKINFFDLDYDYNAKSIHQIFMDEKSAIFIDDDNHPQEINDVSGWYLNNLSGKELSFSIKSYIIAIDSNIYSGIQLKDLYNTGLDLKIWK
ncbi:hypothetical protein HNP77_001186 [Treponema rectale]|uniref:SPOR domain-containing protein n=1 Tax=Treponema rectale TaxID=744512 RepID=A0A840SAS3_9SPIR|nr:SPOR domain-containing protein [Treponema rectale]MBB5218817.1 hypothetical protein [Treponema rectale]